MAMYLSAIVCFLLVVAGVSSGPPNIEPKFKQIKQLTSTSVQCTFDHPLADCQIRVSEIYYRRFDAVLNFRRGRQSPSVKLKKPDGEVLTTASYSGARGLSGGHCGVQLDVVHSGVYLVECFGRKEPGGWGQGYGLLTSSGRDVLPWDKPFAPLVITRRGSTETVLLQSPTAWIGCSIRTPSAGPLDLKPGQAVPSSFRYVLHGGAQENGGCGFKLPDIQEKDAGVWDWYAEKEGPAVWLMTVVIVEDGPQGKPILDVHNPLPLHVGDVLEVSCWAPPASPPVTMTWLLGGEVVRQDDLNDTMPDDVATLRPWQPKPVKQTFSRLLTAADEGKVLSCRIEHAALSASTSADLVLKNIRTSSGPEIEPKFKQIKHLASSNIKCMFDHPLADCQIRVSEIYYRRYDAVLNFRRGRQSPSVALKNSDGETLTTASYSGSGLARGDCGVQLDVVHSGVYLVECFGRKEPGGWGQGYGLLTSSGRDVLPWYKPFAPLVVTRRGSTETVLLQSPTPWVGCSIRTPSAGPLDLTPGQAVPPGRRYLLQGGAQEDGGCGFKLPDVQAKDAGVWDWYAEKQGPAVWLMTVVVVEDGPQGKPVLNVHNPAKLHAGDTLQASCWAPPAAPPVAMTWLLGGEVVRQDELNDTLPADLATVRPWQPRPVKQTLTRRLTPDDEGKELSCVIDHAVLSKPARATLPLHVTANPSVAAETSVIRSAEGHLVELACIVEAQPEAVVQWSRGGNPVTLSPLVISGHDGTRHWLRLEDVTIDDFTEFTCTAKNSVGTASKVVEITGLPGEPTLVKSTGSSLSWAVESYAPITATTLKIRPGKGLWQEVNTLLVTERENVSTVLVTYDLEPTTVGNYSAYLVVANVFGESRPSVVRPFTANPSGATPLHVTGVSCPGLTSLSLDIVCMLTGAVVNCARPVLPSTTARFTCRPGFQLPEPHPGSLVARCLNTGKWSRSLFECTPDCGRRNAVGARPTVVGGKQAASSEFPWHVALFRENNKAFQAICGGTLITPTFVITAAHCVWSETQRRAMPASQYRVAVGKHSRTWEVTDSDEQRFRVAKLYIPPRYAGNVRKLENDIAVLQLAAPAQLSLVVGVVCVDWENEFEYQHFTSRSNGTVPGWGINESDAPSDTLRYVDLPFVPFRECHDSVPDHFQAYITRDKICAGFRGRTTSVCVGDSGGGFVFPSQRASGTRYFIRGVVSSAPLNPGSSKACQSEHRTAFTAVSAHVLWLKEAIFGNRNLDGAIDMRAS